MKSNGSRYVAIVLLALAGYFIYQTWFNPNRIIKRELGELAAALSIPVPEPDIDRIARPARVRSHFAPEAVLKLGDDRGEISPERLAAMLATWTPPPGGVIVSFGDVQINVETRTTARAYVTVEITMNDPGTNQPTADAHEAKLLLAKRDGRWLITSAEPSGIAPRQ